MSWMPGADPDISLECPNGVEMVIIPRTGDIGNFEVHRALPFREKRMVGPFIFWDQMGPGEFLTGQGVDVRPHPHIGLSTVTYLFDGTMDHKDSLGNDMRIVPGDVNLMTAGSGIVHSERTGQDIREKPSQLYGIQSWIAQPEKFEDGLPAFHHSSKDELPLFDSEGVKGRVILGEFDGIKSPVQNQWDTLYVELFLDKATKVKIPRMSEERALYVLKGQIEIGGTIYQPQQMMVLNPGEDVTIASQSDVHMMVLGGATMDSPRHIWWNFVSSSKERLEQAKEDWRNKKFPTIPGDNKEFIPLPDK
ncbi:MAG: pirin family protein [Pseudomonadota bacterium]